MKKKQKLFTLIKTMNRGEKRAFKLFAQKYNKDDSFYIRLFDVIDKSEDYDLDLIKKKVINTEKDLRQFPVIKNQLFNIILFCLRNHKENKSGSSQYNILLDYYDMLMDRGMLHEAFSYLQKAEESARYVEDYPALLSVLDKKKNVQKRLIGAEALEESLTQISNERKEIIEILQVEDWFSSVNENVYHLYRTKGTEVKEVIKLKFLDYEKELILRKNQATSVKGKHFYYLSRTTISFLLDRLEEAIGFVEKHILLLKNNTFFQQLNLDQYLRSVNNFIVIKIEQGKYQEAESSIQALQEEFGTAKKEVNKFVEQRVFEISYSSKLNICLQKQLVEEGLSLIPDIEKNLRNYKNVGMSVDRNIRMCLGVSLLYFWKEEWSKSLEWINKIETFRIENKSNPSQVISYVKLLAIICHFELKNYVYLESLIRSARRYMKKNDRLFPYEMVWLKYLKKISNQPNQTQDFLFELQQKIKKMKTDNPKTQMVLKLPIAVWIDSKLGGKPMVSFFKS